MTNKFPLTIAGCSLTISTPENEDYVKELAAALDAQVSETVSSLRTLPLSHALIVTALDCMDRCKKSEINAGNLRDQIRDYLSDAATAKSEINELAAKYNALAKEYAAYKQDSANSAVSARCDELSRLLAGQTKLTEQANAKSAELSGIISGLEQKLASANSQLESEKNENSREKLEQAQRSNELLNKRLADLAESHEILRQEAEAMAQRNVGLQQQLTLLEQMIDEEMGEKHDIVENAEQAEPLPPLEHIEPSEVRALVGDDVCEHPAAPRPADNEKNEGSVPTTAENEAPNDNGDTPLTQSELEIEAQLDVYTGNWQEGSLFEQPVPKPLPYDWQKDEHPHEQTQDAQDSAAAAYARQYPAADTQPFAPQQTWDNAAEASPEHSDDDSFNAEEAPADHSAHDEPDEASAGDTFTAQRQVEELFDRIADGRSFDPPAPKDPDMPDLGWTHNL